ncbi:MULTISPECIES: TetR/AcrR family transcriptional regulator [unclassified Mycobacteroides]|uniref:TetR/AcrR family transcriptional regulator n=1 Tax=unclassified Mycobacteroides TaxID=2618759 RepID=UPI0028164EB6|nr:MULTISPECIES: TetR/AcrR family transcriptional regulator [unclassified Mycobacteroides]
MTSVVVDGSDPLRRPRGRPRKGGEGVSADSIFTAALRAFATHGYQGMSMRTLNRELGVSHNLLHQRFSSKEQLWYAAVDWGYGSLVEKILASDDETLAPSARITRFIKTFTMFSAEHPELVRIMDIESGQDSERLQHICQNYALPMQERLGPVYDEAVAAGELREIPQQTIFFLITSGAAALCSSSAMARTLFGADILTPEQIERHAEAVAELIVRGLLP